MIPRAASRTTRGGRATGGDRGSTSPGGPGAARRRPSGSRRVRGPRPQRPSRPWRSTPCPTRARRRSAGATTTAAAGSKTGGRRSTGSRQTTGNDGGAWSGTSTSTESRESTGGTRTRRAVACSAYGDSTCAVRSRGPACGSPGAADPGASAVTQLSIRTRRGSTGPLPRRRPRTPRSWWPRRRGSGTGRSRTPCVSARAGTDQGGSGATPVGLHGVRGALAGRPAAHRAHLRAAPCPARRAAADRAGEGPAGVARDRGGAGWNGRGPRAGRVGACAVHVSLECTDR